MEEIKNRNELMEELAIMLLYLSSFRTCKEFDTLSAWKNMDFDTMNRLEEKGYFIHSKKMVTFKDEGVKRAKELLEKYGFTEKKD